MECPKPFEQERRMSRKIEKKSHKTEKVIEILVSRVNCSLFIFDFSEFDRLHNLNIDLWRLRHLVDCDVTQIELYEKLKLDRRDELANESATSVRLDNDFMKDRLTKHTEGNVRSSFMINFDHSNYLSIIFST